MGWRRLDLETPFIHPLLERRNVDIGQGPSTEHWDPRMENLDGETKKLKCPAAIKESPLGVCLVGLCFLFMFLPLKLASFLFFKSKGRPFA